MSVTCPNCGVGLALVISNPDHSSFRQRRKALGFTQGDVSEALGVVHSTVSQWESGLRPIPSRAWVWLEEMEGEA